MVRAGRTGERTWRESGPAPEIRARAEGRERLAQRLVARGTGKRAFDRVRSEQDALVAAIETRVTQAEESAADSEGFLRDVLVGSTALSIPQIQAGTIRGVVQTGRARSATLAAVPTVNESGFPGFDAYAWWGVFAPAGTSKAIVSLIPGRRSARRGSLSIGWSSAWRTAASASSMGSSGSGA